MNEPNNYRFIVKSTENTIKLIEMICASTVPLSFTEIKDTLNIPKSSLSNLMDDMEGYGYLTRNPSTLRYSKGIKLIENSMLCVKNSDILSDIALELDLVCNQIKETFHAGVLDGTNVVYIGKSSYRSTLSLTSRSGLCAPAHSTAMGRALLAQKTDDEVRAIYEGITLERVTPYTLTNLELLIEELHKVREQGYSKEVQQSCMNASCLSVPVYRMDTEESMFAISVTVSSTKLTPEYEAQLIEILHACAKRLSIRESGNV